MNSKEVIKLFLNEDVHTKLAKALRQRGFDAITTVEAGMSGSPDEEQLAFAVSQGRAILTFNRGDYARFSRSRFWSRAGSHAREPAAWEPPLLGIRDLLRLHKRYAEHGWEHSGIIVSEQYPIGELLRRMLNLLMSLSVQDMRNRLEYLSQWGEAIS